MNTYTELPKPFFALAPMDDITDTVFRQIVGECAAPDLYFTEFVNVDGLQSPGRIKVAQRLRLAQKENKVVAQLWGLKPENFHTTAREIAEGVYGAYVGIDLNMGCPQKTIVKNGACAGLINNPNLAVDIIKATQTGVDGKVPVSVKTRLGFNAVDQSWHKLLLEQNLAMLTIHGRTRKEMSKSAAHWESIGQIRELRDQISKNTLIVGNGDVISRAQGSALADKYKLDGIMIGRGVFHDPFVFASDDPWLGYSRSQKLRLYLKHVELFADSWQPGERAVITLNKFCKIYISGFDGAKELRESLMQMKSPVELLSVLNHEYAKATS